MEELPSGAGALPFCVRGDDIYFLFHTTFVGKKVGTLIDFGGATDKNDISAEYTAAREVAEETGGLLLGKEEEITPWSSERILQNTPLVKQAIQFYLKKIEDKSNCWKLHTAKGPEYYIMYIFEIGDVGLQMINKTFSSAPKRREFVWISSLALLNNDTPFPLYCRVTAVKDLYSTIQTIRSKYL